MKFPRLAKAARRGAPPVVEIATKNLEEKMLDARRRLLGRLFYFAVVAITAMGIGLSAFGVPADSQGGTSAATTTVSDTVYLADECLNASTWAKGSTQTSVSSNS